MVAAHVRRRILRNRQKARDEAALQTKEKKVVVPEAKELVVPEVKELVVPEAKEPKKKVTVKKVSKKVSVKED
jgi:hypothetical protein